MATLAEKAEKGDCNLQPDDVVIETAVLATNSECSDDTDRDYESGEAASRAEDSSSSTAISQNDPEALIEEDSDPGFVESNPIDTMDVVPGHSRPTPSQKMNQMLFVLACTRHSEVHKRCSVLVSSGAKTLSAGLYLFDYVSNILVLRVYYIMQTTGKFDGQDTRVGIFVNDKYNVTGFGDEIFYACLGLMLFDPVVAAVAFKLKLPPQEHPLRSAFFLPIVQFRRFVAGIFTTGSCASAFETEESLETEALFAIMSAIETGPQLVLQFTVIVMVGGYISAFSNSGDRWTPSATLIISVVASFLSASYNAGRAIMYQMSKRWTFTLNVSGIAGGMYTIGAVLLRCTAVASLFYEYNMVTGQIQIWFWILYVVGIAVCSYVNGLLVVFSKGRRTLCSWAAQVKILVATYMSATIGPIYPLSESDNGDAKSRFSPNPKCSLHVLVGLAVGINMLPDVLLLLIFGVRHHDPSHPQGILDFGPVSETRYAVAMSDTLTCPEFIGFLATGVALSILPYIILVASLLVSNSEEKRGSHSDEVPIDRAVIVTVSECHKFGAYTIAPLESAA